jgi:hypothetical protein
MRERRVDGVVIGQLLSAPLIGVLEPQHARAAHARKRSPHAEEWCQARRQSKSYDYE